jgi:hypothetical protein
MIIKNTCFVPTIILNADKYIRTKVIIYLSFPRKQEPFWKFPDTHYHGNDIARKYFCPNVPVV